MSDLKGLTATLKCEVCQELFTPPYKEGSIKEEIGRWMADHVERHGGDPGTVNFTVFIPKLGRRAKVRI